MIRIFNKIRYYVNKKCECWKTNYFPSIPRMMMMMMMMIIIIIIIIIIPKYLAFEVLTKERICLRKMRYSAPDYFEIK